MRKLATGILAGSILGAVGITALMSDKTARKQMKKGGKRMLNDAADVMDDVKSKIW